MGSFPMKVIFVRPFPRSSNRITSFAPSIASCSIPNSAGSTLFPFASEKYMEETIFSRGTISWYSPPCQKSCPSGVVVQMRYFPPTRKSIWQTGEVKPFGPHHCITYSGLSTPSTPTRVGHQKFLSGPSARSRSPCFLSSLPLFLHLIYHCFQFVEALFPESAIVKRPVADCFNRLWPERAHTLSSTLRLDHNPRPHQVGDMF